MKEKSCVFLNGRVDSEGLFISEFFVVHFLWMVDFFFSKDNFFYFWWIGRDYCHTSGSIDFNKL